MADEKDDRDGSRSERVVLVLGATGQQGGTVARALRERARNVRAMVRDPESTAARALAATGVVVVRGDLGNAPSIRNAMAGADGVFSVQPNSGSPGSGITDEEEVRIGKLVAEIAVEAGVNHLVYSSASVIAKGATGIKNLDCKLEIEDHVRSLSIPATIVRPATFMELLALPDLWSEDYVLSFFASPDQPIELIAAEDIGKIVAAVFDDRGCFAGTSINIAGDELTGAEIGSVIGRASGRSVTYRRFPDALLKQLPALDKTVRMFESGTAAGNADISALSATFGPLTRLHEWLAGSGRARIQAAVRTADE